MTNTVILIVVGSPTLFVVVVVDLALKITRVYGLNWRSDNLHCYRLAVLSLSLSLSLSLARTRARAHTLTHSRRHTFWCYTTESKIGK